MKCCMELDSVNKVFGKNIEIEPINRFQPVFFSIFYNSQKFSHDYPFISLKVAWKSIKN